VYVVDTPKCFPDLASGVDEALQGVLKNNVRPQGHHESLERVKDFYKDVFFSKAKKTCDKRGRQSETIYYVRVIR
jgi:hypothetical protein